MENNPAQENTRFDVIVWGATGFTGRLVVEYLLQRYPPGERLRWAVAGRSQSKMDSLLYELIESGERPPTMLADSHDPASLEQMTQATRVVLTTVGPYAKYGSELVAACVRNGTHYCDLCGEVQWMRKMIDQHQSAAEESGAKIVMSCGFDSIPSDFGTWFLQQQAQRQHNQLCERITLLVRAMKGGASGGTFASMLNAIDEARRDRNVARVLVDPYALNPAGVHRGADPRDQSGAVLNTPTELWTAPFVMAGVNTRVVRRSNALSGFAYGKDFRYHEATITGKGLPGRLRATVMAIALRLFVVASAIGFTRRWVVEKLLPDPGEGPSKNERENGYFNLLLIGELANGSIIRARVKGDRDPGYGSTSKMLAESAICLALDETVVGGGCWTPVTAMGQSLYERLNANAGLSFELDN
ncbi:MAG: saccharopine dehydrogenase family protein [Woeseiaceae bacterium]